MHGRGELFGAVGSDLLAEFLADCRSDGRGDEGDDRLLLLEGLVELGEVVVLHQGAGGADEGALTALDAGDVDEGAVLDRADDGLEAAVLEAEDTDALGVLAGLDALAAEDALAGVPDDAGSDLVDGDGRLLADIEFGAGADFPGDLEKLAVAVLPASLAVVVMVGEEELDRRPSCRHGGRIGD